MIGPEDMDRLFTELIQGMTSESVDKEWEENFTKEGMSFLIAIVPGTLRQLLASCKSPEEVVAIFTALWVGGVRFGWELKEQYDTPPEDTPITP